MEKPKNMDFSKMLGRRNIRRIIYSLLFNTTTKLKIYSTIRELQVGIDVLAEKGIQKGIDVGFKCLENLYSIKPGNTTYIMGGPTAGKTQFWLECLINISEKYNWNHVIFSPETGNKTEIVAELLHSFTGKTVYKNQYNSMSDKERYDAMTILDNHFTIIDPSDGALTMEKFYKTINEIEKDCDIKIHTTTIDPFNELSDPIGVGARDLNIEKLLTECRKNARATKRHNCIITHCRDQQPEKLNGITFYPMPTARDYANGQGWYRKGLGMLAAWRPPNNFEYEAGKVSLENEVHIEIQKAKPKGIGNKGTAILYFDIKKNRYFELDDYGARRYAWEYLKDIKQPPLQPSRNFTEPQHDPF